MKSVCNHFRRDGVSSTSRSIVEAVRHYEAVAASQSPPFYWSRVFVCSDLDRLDPRSPTKTVCLATLFSGAKPLLTRASLAITSLQTHDENLMPCVCTSPEPVAFCAEFMEQTIPALSCKDAQEQINYSEKLVSPACSHWK